MNGCSEEQSNKKLKHFLATSNNFKEIAISYAGNKDYQGKAYKN